jgi:hypothetical protein
MIVTRSAVRGSGAEYSVGADNLPRRSRTIEDPRANARDVYKEGISRFTTGYDV